MLLCGTKNFPCLNRGVFKEKQEKEAACRHIYRSRFVDELKHEVTPDPLKKSRLVIMNFNSKLSVLNYAPTVQHASPRMKLSITSLEIKLVIFFCAVNQVYTQARIRIRRTIITRPPPILEYPSNTVFVVNLPLYCLLVSDNYWYFTYHRYRTASLPTHSSIYDTCLLYTKGCLSPTTKTENVPR